MNRHLAFAAGSLALVSPTIANSIAPTAYFWPGFLPLAFGLALPASVLAAFLERPFVTWAGVRENALSYSLQANFISLVVGYLTLPLGFYAIYTIGPLWSPVAVALSVLCEGCYYRWRAIKAPDRLGWGPSSWATSSAASCCCCFPPSPWRSTAPTRLTSGNWRLTRTCCTGAAWAAAPSRLG